MQLDARERHRRDAFAGGEQMIIELDERGIGQLHIWEGPEALWLVDIELEPDHQRQGIGAALIQTVIDRARAADLTVRLHVERTSRAQPFYVRLGFRAVGDDGVHVEMEAL